MTSRGELGVKSAAVILTRFQIAHISHSWKSLIFLKKIFRNFMIEYYIEKDLQSEIYGLLTRNSNRLPPKKVLQVLPDDVSINSISTFIELALQKSSNQKRRYG